MLGRIALMTDQTVTDPDELEEILAQIRRDGYNVSVGDLDPAVHSIAAPIRDHAGRVVAAVSVAGPSHRFPPAKVESTVQLVRRSAAEISCLLGHRPAAGEWAKSELGPDAAWSEVRQPARASLAVGPPPSPGA